MSRLLTILFLIVSKLGFSLDKGPEILRICLDDNTSVATLFWQTSTDNCNSFKKYHIYSSENSGPWKLDTVITSLGTTSCGIFLSDPGSEWKFKITAFFACNGIDSFESLPQSIDQNKPLQLELDSVSFDYSTQILSAGWKKNPAPDTKGYRIYQYNNLVNNKIIDSDKTFIILNSGMPPYDKNRPSKITLATFDSCNLFAPINEFHQAAYLNAQIDTCKRSITFNWSKYQSSTWGNVNQYLIVNRNDLGFTIDTLLSPNQTNYTLNNITLGDNLCYYLRTEDIITKKTSSSNTICFKTRKLNEPKINYVSNVTVDENTSIKIYFEADNGADTDSFRIEKKEGNSSFKSFMQFKTAVKTSYTIEDLAANFNTMSYSYRIKTIDKCRNISSVSNIGKSIFLSVPILNGKLYNFTWNLYDGWEKGIENQVIEFSNDRFTWNLFKNETPGATSFTHPSDAIESDSLCFRIKNIETINSINNSSVSVSNIKCIYTITDFYIPGTLNPYSNNNVLKVYGNGIDKTRGKIEVYNRWGERIFESKDITEGWNGKVNDEFVMMGNYIYKVFFYDLQNNYYLKTGTVFIIK